VRNEKVFSIQQSRVAPATCFSLSYHAGSPTLGERWISEEAAGHRRTEAWAGALQDEGARGMLFSSRKI
jgi:hypothetical protein